MSRSLASRSLTTRPSMWISPPEISSRPASMRSKVDLPQPDGPTSTTNSPSSMSKPMPWMTLTLPYAFSILRKESDAMYVDSRSALHCAGGEARHHVALEGVIDCRRRQRVDEGRGHQQFPRRIV